MHQNGKPVASRETLRSARLLTATSITILLVKVFNVPIDQIQLVGVPIPLDAVRWGAAIAISFQTVSHMVHWMGDYLSRHEWNSAHRITDPTHGIEGGSPSVSKLEAVSRIIDKIVEREETDQSNPASDRGPSLGLLSGELGHAKRILEEIRVSAIRWKRFADFYFVFWLGLAPIAIALVALALPTPTLALP